MESYQVRLGAFYKTFIKDNLLKTQDKLVMNNLKKINYIKMYLNYNQFKIHYLKVFDK